MSSASGRFLAQVVSERGRNAKAKRIARHLGILIKDESSVSFVLELVRKQRAEGLDQVCLAMKVHRVLTGR